MLPLILLLKCFGNFLGLPSSGFSLVFDTAIFEVLTLTAKSNACMQTLHKYM